MEERDERGPVQDLERVSGNFEGGAFPRPPILPVVATLALLVGLSLGLALAPRAPTPTTATATQFGAASVAPTVPPSPHTLETTAFATAPPTAAASPPLGGIPVSQAIAAAEEAFGIADAAIADVSLVDNGTFYSDPSSGHLWSWQIVVRELPSQFCVPWADGASGYVMIVPDGSPEPQPSSVTTTGPCRATGLIMVDYLTGRAVMMVVASPSLPDGMQFPGFVTP
jgi:hypothetical protein